MITEKAQTEIGNLREHVFHNIKELRAWRLREDDLVQLAKDFGAFDKSAIYSVVIKAEDGHESHCVAIYDGWIFDSNEESALPLCKASLDYICCEGERHADFEGFLFGYKFYSSKQTNGMTKITAEITKSKTKNKNRRLYGRSRRKRKNRNEWDNKRRQMKKSWMLW